MNKLIVGLIVVVLIVAGGYLYYGKPSDTTSPPSQTTSDMTADTKEYTSSDTPNTNDTPPVSVNTNITAATKEFTVTGSNFAFAPSNMTVKKGTRVKIIFVNSGGTHDFKIDEFNIATKRIQGGTQDIVEFTADKAGSFEYYCSIGNHRAMGMKGTLVVTE